MDMVPFDVAAGLPHQRFGHIVPFGQCSRIWQTSRENVRVSLALCRTMLLRVEFSHPQGANCLKTGDQQHFLRHGPVEFRMVADRKNRSMGLGKLFGWASKAHGHTREL
eukprot:5794419-Amphidinium_carterae.1